MENQPRQNRSLGKKRNHSKSYNSFYSYGDNKTKLILIRQANQIKETRQVKQIDAFSAYLERVKEFCSDILTKQDLSLKLTTKEAMEIVLVADRLQVSRIDALKSWKVSKKGVVISPNFLRSLFVSLDLLSGGTFYITKKDGSCTVRITAYRYTEVIGEASPNQYLGNGTCKSDMRKIMSELALMDALRKAFPDSLIGVICPAEVPPSAFSEVKSLLASFYQKLEAFCSYLFIRLIAAINTISSIIARKTTSKIENKVQANSARNDENDLFLDFDDLQVKSNYETKHLN